MAVCCKGLLIWAVSGKASILGWKKLLPRIASLAGLRRRRRSAGMSALSSMDDPLAGQHSVRGELLLLLLPPNPQTETEPRNHNRRFPREKRQQNPLFTVAIDATPSTRQSAPRVVDFGTAHTDCGPDFRDTIPPMGNY